MGAAWKNYVSYSSINFGFSLLGMTASMLLMYYYTDVLLLPASAVSVVLFISRMFDGVIDPFLGHYMDKRTTKFGKYRGYVIYWAPAACVTFVLMFSAAPFTEAGKAIWCLLLYLAFTLTFSFVEIASLPMLASFDTAKSRMAGNTLKISGCIAATLVAAMFAFKLVQVLGGGAEAPGYARMAMLFGGVALAALLLGGLGFSERDYAVTAHAGDTEKSCSAKEAIFTVLREKSILFILLMFLCLDAASAFKMQAGIYYLKYNLGRQDMTSLFLTSSIAMSLLAQPLVFYCSRRVGMRFLMVHGCAASAAAMLIIGLSGSSVALLLAGNCLFGVLSAFPANLIFAYMVDLFEWLGKKRGRPFGGVTNAFIGLSSRVGGSLASALLSLILVATAYAPNREQSGLALWGITAGFIVLPVLLLLLGSVFAALSFRTFEAEASLRKHGSSSRGVVYAAKGGAHDA